MYKNRAANGAANLCAHNVAILRKQHIPPLSQRGLADLLQMKGLDLDKNAIQRIEAGKRFVTDIELKFLAEVFNVSTDELLVNFSTK